MASKLLLYNNALLLCGERKLDSLTENREPRRLLDDVYDGGALRTCLEEGVWNFATRSIRIDSDPGIDPDFGFDYGFVKPDDWVRTSIVSANEYFRSPLKDYYYSDEAGYWWSDIDPLYVRYVSDGADYGGNLGNWPESFARYFEAYLARRIADKLTKSQGRLKSIDLELARCRKGAVSKDAMNNGAAMPPEGSWSRSRRAYGGFGRRDGGTRSRLLG